MSFTRMLNGKKRTLKLRCGSCGSTRGVVTYNLGAVWADLCLKCATTPMQPDQQVTISFKTSGLK